jgi:hypothetical protein
MNDKAGSMGGGAAWGIAVAGSAVGSLVGGFVPGIVGWLLATLFIAGAGWAAVFMTKATAGKGIVTFLVGGVASFIVTYVVYKSQIASSMAAATAELAKNAKSTGNVALDTQLAGGGAAVMQAAATAGLIMAGVFSFLRTFLIGMIGCFIGNAMKKTALAGSGASVAKAA